MPQAYQLGVLTASDCCIAIGAVGVMAAAYAS